MTKDNFQFKVNASIQLVPLGGLDTYKIIDLAIEEIQKTGFPYEVGPFSTSIEATLDEILSLITAIRNRVFNEEAQEILINVQIQARKNGDVSVMEKVRKHRV